MSGEGRLTDGSGRELLSGVHIVQEYILSKERQTLKQKCRKSWMNIAHETEETPRKSIGEHQKKYGGSAEHVGMNGGVRCILGRKAEMGARDVTEEEVMLK